MILPEKEKQFHWRSIISKQSQWPKNVSWPESSTTALAKFCVISIKYKHKKFKTYHKNNMTRALVLAILSLNKSTNVYLAASVTDDFLTNFTSENKTSTFINEIK